MFKYKFIIRKFNIKLVETLMLFCLIYQTISLTLDYCNFETVVDMKVDIFYSKFPSVSFCIDSGKKFNKIRSEISANLTIDEYLQKSIICKLLDENPNQILKVNETFDCVNEATVVKSITPHARRCITYLSRLFSKNFSIHDFNRMLFNVKKNFNFSVLTHSSSVPPHLLTNKFKLNKYGLNVFDFTSVIEILLSFPYQTDCIHYKNDLKQGINPYKSQEDCIVDKFHKIELRKCHCNKKWLYFDVKNKSQNICDESIECKIDINRSETGCRKNCLNEFFSTNFKTNVESDKIELENSKYLFLMKAIRPQLVVRHLPKLSLVQYFCSIGGLAAMWFGTTISEALTDISCKFKYLLLIIHRILFRNRNILNERYNRNIWGRIQLFEWIIKKLKLILLSILMFYQVSIVLMNYSKYETITRLEVKHQNLLPLIRTRIYPSPLNCKYLIETYPEIKKTLKNIDFGESFDCSKYENDFLNIYQRVLMKHLSKSEIERLRYFVDTIEIIDSCHIIIDSKSIKCQKSDSGIHINSGISLTEIIKLKSTQMNSTNMALIREKNLEKVVLKFKGHGIYAIFFKIGFLPLYVKNTDTLLIQKNMTTRIYYSSYSMKFVSTENGLTSDFSEEYQYNCSDDCFMNHFNQTYGCIPFLNISLIINLKKYIYNHKYRFCDSDFESNLIQNAFIMYKCLNQCLYKSEYKYFDTTTESIQSVTNETIVEIIPKNSPHIRYIETLKMDFNKLIYDCGGTLGLWFGLSPLSLDFFNSKLPQIIACMTSVATNLILFFKNRKTDFINFLNRVLN